MKLFTTLTLATLLSAGTAFAASTSPTSTPTATPAASAAPAARKHASTMHCDKEAKAKKLTGDEAAKFVKECQEGTKD